MLSTLNECNTEQVFVADDKSLVSVIGPRIVHLDKGQFNDVLCVHSLCFNLPSVSYITHFGEDKTTVYSPHQVVIKDLKDPKHALAIGIVDDITRL